MKRQNILIFLLLWTVFYSCELDSFLFNEKQIDKYTLPGNTIPVSNLEMVTFNSEGHKLYGYWVQSNGSRPGLTILYCHGNKHNMDEYWDRVMLLYDLGVNVFVFDYRGYGLSEGESSESGLYKDGEAALRFVLGEKGVAADSVCLYGYSLGNVVSIYLAAEKINPLTLFAESPFASANSLTQGSTVLDIPAKWLTTGKFNNAEKIKKIKTPLFLLHGSDDDFVRYRDNGKIVFQNAPQPKSLNVVAGAAHNNIPDVMGSQNYLAAISAWINYSTNINK
ncbi:alpha/beta hydrolase [candidate division KSB1 bacterium]|nr:alpha/beta hydrolase [candidate division KSB1 bacterium]